MTAIEEQRLQGRALAADIVETYAHSSTLLSMLECAASLLRAAEFTERCERAYWQEFDAVIRAECKRIGMVIDNKGGK